MNYDMKKKGGLTETEPFDFVSQISEIRDIEKVTTCLEMWYHNTQNKGFCYRPERR